MPSKKWRWARDSNPGNLSVQRFSRPPLSTTQPAHQNCAEASPDKERALYRRALSDQVSSLPITTPIKLRGDLWGRCSLWARLAGPPLLAALLAGQKAEPAR